MRASVLREIGAPAIVTDVTLNALPPDGVRVRIAAAGVCHSDLSLARGTLRQPVPAVLGHEGAGVVTEVGAQVRQLRPGTRVVLSWAPPCGECVACRRGEPWLCERAADRAAQPYGRLADGAPVVPSLSTGAFAEETVVPERACVPVPDGVPLEQAALVGCAVATGVGAVLNTAKVRPGERVLVIGLGGVGLSCVQGARLAGAGAIVATDTREDKLALAERLGATHTVLADADLAAQVRALTGGEGVDAAFDAVGAAATIRSAWAACRRGGRATIIGIGGRDEKVTFSALELFHYARTLQVSVYGSVDPAVDFPRLLRWAADGALDLAALVTNQVGLDGVNDAFAAMAAGRGIRTLVLPERPERADGGQLPPM